MNLASRRGAVAVPISSDLIRGSSEMLGEEYASLRVKSSVMAGLCYQLAMQLGAGIPLARVLEVLGQTEDNRKMSEFLLRAHEDVNKGKKLVQAFAVAPTPFSRAHLAMIDAGELAGGLPNVFDRLGNMFENQEMLSRQVKSATRYPVMVFFVAMGISLFVLVKIMPQFVTVFEESKMELPFITTIMVAASKFLTGQPLLAIAGGTCIILGAYTLMKTLRALPFVQDILLSTPVLGEFIRAMMRCQFFIVLGQLSQAGVPLPKALVICGSLHPYAAYRESNQNFVTALGRGKPLYTTMADDRIFGRRAAQLVETGEKSGDLGGILTKSGNRLESELTFKLKGVTQLLEPVVIVVLGTIVGLLVAGIFLPIFQAAQSVQ